MSLAPSFRTRILLVVLVAAVIPLGMVGLGLARSAERSGEALLRSRMAAALDDSVDELVSRWLRRRSALLDLADDRAALDALSDGPASPAVPGTFLATFHGLEPAIRSARVLDASGHERWRTIRPLDGDASSLPFAPTAPIRVDMREPSSGRLLGTLEVEMGGEGLLPPGGVPAAAGMVVALFADRGAESLSPTGVDPLLLAEDRFAWGGEDWITARRRLPEPPLELVVAAPLSGFIDPFRRASRTGVGVLLLVAALALGAAALVSERLTRSLARLSAAADAVAGGQLARRVEVDGDDEVARLTRAFNAMTASLERTLERLASRESLAAVGHFAASLAHEVRNPLTAIRLDLQRVQEALPSGFPLRGAHDRALAEIERLDRTVSSTLAAARSGGLSEAAVDVRIPLRAAMDAARPAFDARGATLGSGPMPDSMEVLGDAGALEQVFLNLLRNAAEAQTRGEGGRAWVELRRDRDDVVVTVEDDGEGIPQGLGERVFEALFTTRGEGTGLGLTVARRVAVAHGGSLDLENRTEGGARAIVRLPLLADVDGGRT